jgi:hypothetical protein
MQGLAVRFSLGGLPSTVEMTSSMVSYKAEEKKGDLGSRRDIERHREEGKERLL